MWEPLVDGDRTAQIVAEICDEAAAEWMESPQPGLLGQAGHAVMFHYASEAGIGDYRASASACVERACAAIAETALSASLHRGVAGIAWVVQHLSRADEPDVLADIDALLQRYVAVASAAEVVAGIGVYALERMPRAPSLLAQVVTRLGEIGWESRVGDTIVTNLGVSHGVPGILAVLAGAATWGLANAREMFEPRCAWLWRQRDPDAAIQFPYWLADGCRANRQWPGWCTGDPGVAGAMLAAARAIGGDETMAIELGHHAVTWSPARFARLTEAQLLDLFGEPELVAGWIDNPFLCHGSAGRLHIYNRMHHATGDERFARAARDWLATTLALRRTGARLGGFSRGDDDGGSLLYGATGVALALMAAATPIEPRWDRLLMLSLAALDRAELTPSLR